ncbi:MAG: EAL domain-containing protein [Gammaproteobacteria bacterium]|nr:MAG: EAL domain-containing protein [Gammaproteobacteria bacterium]
MPSTSRYGLWALICALLILSVPGGAAAAVSARILWLEDSSGNQSLAQIQSAAPELWQSAPASNTLNPGYNTSAFWLRVQAENIAGTPDHYVLEIAFPALDYVDVFLVDPLSGRRIRHWKTGDRLPYSTRPVDFETFAFNVDRLTHGRWPEAWIRIQSTGGVQIPVRLYTPNDFVRHVTKSTMTNSFYYGTMLLMVLLNALMFWQIRSEKAFFYYALTCLGMVTLVGSLRGSVFRYLVPEWPEVAHELLLGSIFTVLGALSAFTICFLRLTRHAPRLSGFFRMTAGTAFFFLLSTPFTPYQTQNLIAVLLAVLILVPMALTGPWCWFRGVPRARLYTLATGILVVGGLITSLANLALLPANGWTQNALQAGSVFDALMLTVALAIRMGDEHRDRERQAAHALASQAAREAAERELQRSALMDPVTGLPNRQVLMRRLEHESNRSLPGGLLVFSLPKLTEASGTLGTALTEQAIQQALQILCDALARIPGIQTLHLPNENKGWPLASLDSARFAALLQPGRSLTRAHHKIFEHLFDTPLEIGSQRLPQVLHVGAVYTEFLKGDPDQWLARATWACEQLSPAYSGVRVYDDKGQALHERRSRIVGALEDAIHGHQLALWYQPQLNLQSQRIEGVEALLRWIHPEIGFIPPDEIVQVAIQSGQIRALTRWVLNKGLSDLKTLRQHRPDLRLSINVSARNLEERDFAGHVLETLRHHHLDASALCLELTETEIFIDPELAQNNLDTLHKAGVSLSLDDFGTGYSNLAQLNALKLSELKVDRSLIPDGRLPKQVEILSQTVMMGKAMDCRVVGEGVEDAAQLACLRRTGCDTAQGYYVKRPATVEELSQWLEDFDPWAFGLGRLP